MKASTLILAGALLVFTPSVESGASGIYQADYTYSFDGMVRGYAQAHAFVICEQSPVTGPYLSRASRFPALAARVSRDIPGPKGKEKEPQAPGRGIAMEQGTKDEGNSPGPSTTVFFALDSATLDDAAKAKLSSFAENTGAKTKGNDLTVTGYTCDLGSRGYNDILAKKRAEAVAARLRKAGVRPSLVKGTGKCCYATQDPGKRYLNRRVEIRISEKEATK